MQDLSFYFPTHKIDLWGLAADVMVYTFENAYGLDTMSTTTEVTGDTIRVTCRNLLCCGGQAAGGGSVSVEAIRSGENIRVGICAAHPTQSIRSVKLTVHGLDATRWVNKLDLSNPEITAKGIIAAYPEGWRTIDTPMILLDGRKDGRLTCLRSLDTSVRDKRFVMKRTDGAVDAELIFEVYAHDIDRKVTVPVWEICLADTVEHAYKRHREHIESAYNLVPWEERCDVPGWARKISLVAAIHGQHWTGYIFNDYAKMLKSLEWFCARLDGKHILAFLPGWEGRYYWQYGDYRPCGRMGGNEGFRKLCDGAREMGVHLMPMFGINIVNRGIPGFEYWGTTSLARDINGQTGVGSVDWDASRHYNHGSNAVLNPGAPMWQRRLTSQITDLAQQYGFSAAFLDIAACWYNDPHFIPCDLGVKVLCDTLRDAVQDFLVCGEAWYDGLTPAMPVIHSGHTDGPMHYHDAIYAPFFDTYMREFAHLCLGDAGRGSTGVHELGTNRVDWRVPLRKGLWPTATIVEDTLEKAPKKVELIIADAKEYAKKYL